MRVKVVDPHAHVSYFTIARLSRGDFLREPVFVPDSKSIRELLRELGGQDLSSLRTLSFPQEEKPDPDAADEDVGDAAVQGEGRR